VSTKGHNFHRTLEDCFVLKTNNSQRFEEELDRMVQRLAEADMKAWPELRG
jgi:hypothetical protein